MAKGRTLEQKTKLVKEISDTFINIAGGNLNALNVIIQEYDKDNWALGGKLLSAAKQEDKDTVESPKI